MPTPAKLFLLQDLEIPIRTRDLADRDLQALRAVADWIQSFVTRPHAQLGRAGPVCPFVPQAVEHRTLWLAPEIIGDRSVAEVVALANDYQELLLRSQATAGDDPSRQAVVVVFSDLSADRARDYFDDVRIQDFKRHSYARRGVVVGDFHPRNEGVAVRNPRLQPFKAPVPFLLMRHAIVDDWVFFLENDDWFEIWARRFGESAIAALRENLRHTSWRSQAGSAAS